MTESSTMEMEPEPVEGFPLSPQQRRAWAVAGGTSARSVVEIRGELDRAGLVAALARLVERYEVLRTRLVEIDGLALPLKSIEESVSVELAEGPAAEGDGVVTFALRSAGDGRHLLDVVWPPLATDPAGAEHLVDELVAELDGEGSDEVLQYEDVAVAMDDLLEAGKGSGDQLHWRRLAELARAAEAAPRSESRRVARRLEGGAPRVERLAEAVGASAEAVVLTLWELVLRRVADRRPVPVVAVAVDGRSSHPELERALGLFERRLPVAVDPAGGQRSFAEAVRARDAALTEARDRQDSFEPDLFADAEGVTPWPATFAWRRQAPPRRAGGMELSLVAHGPSSEPSALDLEARVVGGDLHLAVTGADAAEPWRSEVLVEALVAALDDAVAGGGEVSPDALAVVGQDARERLAAANDTGRDLPGGERTLWGLVAETARRTPEATALVADLPAGSTEELRYDELVARARAVAAALAERGVGSEDRVGLAAERSAAQVVGLLGVLAAGAAWVPLDPALPPGRLAHVVEAAGLAAVLRGPGGDRVLELVPSELPVVDLAAFEAVEVATPGDGPAGSDAAEWSGDTLAYVLFTSGSTGRPKGVANAHRGIVNRVLWAVDELELGAGDRMLYKTPASFDASLWEIFAPLASGGTTVVAAAEAEKDPAALAAVVERLEVTVLQLVPSVLRVVIERPEVERWRRLRLLASGGEALPLALARRSFERLRARVEMINLYGPTEVSIDATHHPVRRQGDDAADAEPVVPIGRPIANASVWIVDRALRLLPPGASGELAVGGRGVARGYLDDPRQTAERFVPDPFSGVSGARLYATGDRAWQDPSGVTCFVGRLDLQTKVRGVRLELEEVEALLVSHLSVAAAAARVWPGREPGGERLVAYAVPTDRPVDPDELSRHLEDHLPSGLGPIRVMVLDALPQGSSGKLDRGSLPEPPSVETRVRAPRTPIEEVLVGIWREVLALPPSTPVGIDTDFFDSGGHSLLAGQVTARVRDALGVEASIRDLFQSPTVAALGELVAARLRGRAGGGGDDVPPPVVPVPRDGASALSFAQQRLWFLDRLEPGNPVYNLPVSLEIRGPLREALLRRALSAVVARHEVLRTTYQERGGRPVQVIAEPAPLPLPLVDLTGLPEDRRRPEARRQLSIEAGSPFDLAAGPVLRALLMRWAADAHAVAVTVHHIASDGWSSGVLLGEVTQLYRAFDRSEPSPLEPLAVQYADYAAWERARFETGALDGQLDYWRRTLAGVPVLEMPTDRPRPLEPDHRGGRVEMRFPAELTDGLAELARRHRATPYMVLLALYQTLLARLTGTDDIAVGSPVAHRERTEIEPLVGFFLNTLVLRTEVDPTVGFDTVLRRVRETVVDAHAHQDVPFEQLVEELAPDRSRSVPPLFQALFVLQNLPRVEAPADELRLAVFDPELATAKVDLALVMVEGERELVGSWEYATALFDRPTVERWSRWFETLAREVVARPEVPLGSFDLLSGAERRAVLEGWGRSDDDAPAAARVEALVRAAAGCTPNATALVWGGPEAGELSYAALVSWADAIAHRLAAAGVGPEDRVGLLAERTPGAMAAILGIFATGAVYVPVDPSAPAERIRTMMEAAAVAAIVVTPEHAETELPAGVPVLVVDAPETPPEDALPPATPGAAGTAYVIFTSGSTGVPKGVVVSHDSLSRFVVGLAERVGLEPGERMFQFASLSFDASLLQILPPLASGAAVVLHEQPAVLSSSEMRRYAEEHGVTVLDLPVALWSGWAGETDGLRPAPSVRTAMTGGERVSRDLLRAWGAAVPAEAVLWSSYGPTETTVTATLERITGAEAARADSGLLLGRPLPGVAVRLLDRAGQPVGPGLVGELCLGGPGLGRGYLDDPAATARSFVPDDHGDEAGGRLYRTGDLARWLPDGRLEFLGRVDHQVKVRGFRVEPGEVEVALAAHPRVERAVVVARGEGAARRLIAYTVLTPAMGEIDPTAGELRHSVGDRLPEHMVPSRLMILERLPLLPSGKVDRRALPEPEMAPEAEREMVAPRGPVEEVVAEIWCDVLGLERVGVEADFFDLGGHSLLATQVISRLRDLFGYEIPLASIFTALTVAELAEVLVDEEPEPGLAEATAETYLTVAGLSPDEVAELLGADEDDPSDPSDPGDPGEETDEGGGGV